MKPSDIAAAFGTMPLVGAGCRLACGLEDMDHAAWSTAPVLVTDPNSSRRCGLARLIHDHSWYQHGPIVAWSCQIAETRNGRARRDLRLVLELARGGFTIPVSTFYELGEPGVDVSLKIHTHVREDALQLFGFWTSREKELFLKLTSVSGVGPKLGITMLSGMPAGELMSAITNNDLARLTSIPGVGRKTAERVVVELRDKLAVISLEAREADRAAREVAPGEAAVRDDTIAALMALGYPKAIAERAVSFALREEGDRTIEAVLKRALRRLSG